MSALGIIRKATPCDYEITVRTLLVLLYQKYFEAIKELCHVRNWSLYYVRWSCMVWEYVA